MKLNNKGFAISTIMYIILIMAVVLISITLSLLSNRKLVLDKAKQEAKEIIYEAYDISYRQALNILTNEAIVYANKNNIENETIKVNKLNSSVDIDILKGYKLYNKNISIVKTAGVYNIYFN